MTNNQTIDGLDRETLAFALGFKCHGYKNRTDQQADKQNALDKIRAIMDAPVVEHQEPKGSGSLEFDGLLAQFHAIVWASAEDGDCDYDLAGVDTAKKLQAMFRAQAARIADLESGKGEAQITLKPFRDLPYGAKFRYQGSKEVWVRTQHNVIAEWKDKLTRHDRQSLCCFCHLEGDEDGNTLDTLVEVVE